MATSTPVEAFAVQFTKLSVIEDLALIQKNIDVQAFVVGNSAIANAKGDAVALGNDTHTETLGLTSTTAVQGVGSSSSSIAESVSAVNNPHFMIA